jgi:hypothetical protein
VPPQVNESDRAEYIRSLLAAVPGLSLDGQRIVIDCANGAASAIAPQLFAQLNEHGGGDVILTHASPNGRNINQNCGALYPGTVAAEVVQHHAAMGITFDGDADRVMFADAHGNVVNGDAVLLLAARDLAERGMLPNSTVVATTMSNMGLEAALKRSGIRMLRAPVGDKYVLEEMLAAAPPAMACSPRCFCWTLFTAAARRWTSSPPTSRPFRRSSSTSAFARSARWTRSPRSPPPLPPPRPRWPIQAASSSATPEPKRWPAS